jgi:hypothetical protein
MLVVELKCENNQYALPALIDQIYLTYVFKKTIGRTWKYEMMPVILWAYENAIKLTILKKPQKKHKGTS